LGIERHRPAGSQPLEDSFLTVLIELFDPQGNRAAMHLKQAGDLRRSVTFQAEDNAVQPLGDAQDTILKSLTAQLQ
jgi:hypothetical protein